MRVENIGISRNRPDSPQRPGLSEGDVLIAEVTDIKGDKVFLKNQDGGAVLTAKLLGDIGVAVGDYVETVVDEASGGRYVLRVVDISRQAPFATESELSADIRTMSQAVKAQALLSTLAMLKNNPGADPKTAAFLSRHGLAGTAENIEVLSQMAKGPAPLTALLTQIIKTIGTNPKAFSQNGPASLSADPAVQTAQPLQADLGGNTHTTLSDGQGAADKAGQTAGQTQTQSSPVHSQTTSASTGIRHAASAETVPNQAAAAVPAQTGPAQNSPVSGGAAQNMPQQTLPDEAKMPSVSTQTAEPAPAATAEPVQQSQSPAQPQTNPAAGEPGTQAPQTMPLSGSETANAAGGQALDHTALPIHADTNVPGAEKAMAGPFTDRMADVPQTERSAVPQAADAKTAAAKNDNLAENAVKTIKEGDEIVQKALGMLAPMEDAEKLAVHIKKAVREMPEQLKELKLLADHADNTVRDAVTSKLDQAEKQMSLMNEVKRFDCYQIPLQTNTQQQTTAELFVYRHRGGKKAVDPDNILILLGLDMQYMGRVETLVKTSGKTLNIEFNMEDMRLADDMRTDAAQLKGAVQQAGYTLSGVSVKQLVARTTVLNAEERFEKETDGSAGSLDIRV